MVEQAQSTVDQRALWIAEVADQRRRASARAQRPYDPREHDVSDPYFPNTPWLVPEQQAISAAKRLHDSVNDLRSIEQGDRAALKRLQEKLKLLDKYQPRGAQDRKRAILEMIKKGEEARAARKVEEKARVRSRLQHDPSSPLGSEGPAQSTPAIPSILRRPGTAKSTPLTRSVSFAASPARCSQSPRQLLRSRSPLSRPRPEGEARQRDRRRRFPLDVVGDEARAQQVAMEEF